MGLQEVSYARNGDVSVAYRVLGGGPIDLAFVGGFVSHLEIAWEAAPVRHFFKQTGDGFLAAFDGPARAVLCAAPIAEG